MPRTFTSETITVNALRVLSISTDVNGATATLAYEAGTVVQVPVMTGGQQTGTELSFVPHPEAANRSSVTLALSDALSLGAQKQALVSLALQAEGLDLLQGDTVLTT